MLRDGETELVRYYCARRTKTELSRPHVKPYVIYQRSIYDRMKALHKGASTYEIKALVGQQWRDMSADEKLPFVEEAQTTNRLIRSRMATADPQQLLVRHEMWLQKSEPGVAAPSMGPPSKVLVHYLGDDAFQCLSKPPRPILVRGACRKRTGLDDFASSNSNKKSALSLLPSWPDLNDADDTVHPDDETVNIQLILGCVMASGTEPFVASTIGGNSLYSESSEISTDSPVSNNSESPPEKRRMHQHLSERMFHSGIADEIDSPHPPPQRVGMETDLVPLEELLPCAATHHFEQHPQSIWQDERRKQIRPQHQPPKHQFAEVVSISRGASSTAYDQAMVYDDRAYHNYTTAPMAPIVRAMTVAQFSTSEAGAADSMQARSNRWAAEPMPVVGCVVRPSHAATSRMSSMGQPMMQQYPSQATAEASQGTVERSDYAYDDPRLYSFARNSAGGDVLDQKQPSAPLQNYSARRQHPSTHANQGVWKPPPPISSAHGHHQEVVSPNINSGSSSNNNLISPGSSSDLDSTLADIIDQFPRNEYSLFASSPLATSPTPTRQRTRAAFSTHISHATDRPCTCPAMHVLTPSIPATFPTHLPPVERSTLNCCCVPPS